jgi:hypothetical protein
MIKKNRKEEDMIKKDSRKSPSAITFCDFQWLGKCFILSYTIKRKFSKKGGELR